ncbi:MULTISPECIES: hypothetical protein [Methylomonas]|uniref:Uncharacterized protein n=1 Tax=Methylomonas koyamae TaxID=702114 RepID=A0A291IKA9_9GAMM|nr:MULTISPECIES: hypothetical protein [Methylomonas]ANE55741.1 hypothetical protein AYM39_11485 [Methylomonas sp. DH-1]ATG90597.1 hypothetical protein MKLM6_2374 [Methylomonas koyamae]OAI28356.1 hypothetical protein A1356_07210 [Methylomonas koyamae]WNB73908.1 hypothetical protein RI210_11470 [Methylomonas koyamae]
MQNFTLAEGLYLYPTPAGAYYAVAFPDSDKPRRFLLRLLQQAQTPALALPQLQSLMEIEDEHKALEMLLHCQKLGWVQGVDTPLQAPAGALEDVLPGLLAAISESGKVLLADDQGFYLACSGFPHEAAEELSALSAELATVHKRRSGLLSNNMGIASHAWAIVDAFGASQIGFWPIFVGGHRFVLAIAGTPHFNQAEFVSLAWILTTRYVKKGD